MVYMGMRYYPCWCTHKCPRLCTQVETELELGNTPVRLQRRARIPLYGYRLMYQTPDWMVPKGGLGLDHVGSNLWRGMVC